MEESHIGRSGYGLFRIFGGVGGGCPNPHIILSTVYYLIGKHVYIYLLQMPLLISINLFRLQHNTVQWILLSLVDRYSA